MAGSLDWIILVLLILVLGSLTALGSKVEAVRLQVNALAMQLKGTSTAKLPPEVLGLLQAGRKIEAIKVYREATGAGLAEAKNAVEAMETGAARFRREDHPGLTRRDEDGGPTSSLNAIEIPEEILGTREA